MPSPQAADCARTPAAPQHPCVSFPCCRHDWRQSAIWGAHGVLLAENGSPSYIGPKEKASSCSPNRHPG